jgi:hypothetical protein
MHRICAAALAVSLCACGLTMTHGPDPRRPADQRPSCTESMDAPKHDAIGAVIGLFAILGGVVVLKYGDAKVGAPLLVGGVVVTAASYASGGIGYARIKKCRRAVAAFDARVQSP